MNMTSNVIDTANANHYQWGENCDSWVFVDTEGLSVKKEYMPAGTKESLHFHHTAKQFFYILNGTATFYLETEAVYIQKEKGIIVQPCQKYFIANESGEPLEFLVISQPATTGDRTNFNP